MHSNVELLTSSSDAEYRSTIEEFDRLWQSGTTQDQQNRMAKLLNKIEAFEKRTLNGVGSVSALRR